MVEVASKASWSLFILISEGEVSLRVESAPKGGGEGEREVNLESTKIVPNYRCCFAIITGHLLTINLTLFSRGQNRKVQFSILVRWAANRVKLLKEWTLIIDLLSPHLYYYSSPISIF